MGVLPEPASLIKALTLPPGFSVCELGDQCMAGGVPGRKASTFYRDLGCGRYVSIDGNGDGTVTADLNRPVTALGLGTFDLVTDFGTGEHIFDQAQVWRTMHELTKPGGHIAFDRPMRGYEAHGFYLVTKGLLLDIAAANQYVRVAFATADTPRGTLLRGVFRRTTPAAFAVPQQRRYVEDLRALRKVAR